MSVNRTGTLRAACAALALATVLFARLAHAGPGDDAKAICIEAHVRAQEQRKAGALLDAVETLGACSAEACPALVRKDCVAWSETWQAAIPSIVVDARDADGGDLSAARLSIDGQFVADRLDGRALPLDPGEHEVRIDLADGSHHTTKVLLREGEQRRRVLVGPPPRSAPPPAPASRYTAAAWAPLAAVATIGTVLFGGLAAAGKIKESDLEACAPRCRREDVDEMRSLYLGADISLGVGAAGAVGLALYFAIAGSMGPPPPDRVTWFVAPIAGGGAALASFVLPGF